MAMKKGGLGRGLGSLFEETSQRSDEADSSIVQLKLADITPDEHQPRKHFDQTAMSELAASIAEHGVLQPIVVRSVGLSSYKIIAGERRWRAARMAGLTELPVIVRELTDIQAMEIALIENLQREDLSPVEEAGGYRQLMERCGYTQEAVASRLGKSRSAVANSLRLLNLSAFCQELLTEKSISVGHAKVLLSLENMALQDKAAALVKERGLSVRETEALCRSMTKRPKEKRERFREALPCEVELSLAERLGTQVKVQYQNGKGTLQVHFYSDDQLKIFANLLGGCTTS